MFKINIKNNKLWLIDYNLMYLIFVLSIQNLKLNIKYIK